MDLQALKIQSIEAIAMSILSVSRSLRTGLPEEKAQTVLEDFAFAQLRAHFGDGVTNRDVTMVLATAAMVAMVGSSGADYVLKGAADQLDHVPVIARHFPVVPTKGG